MITCDRCKKEMLTTDVHSMNDGKTQLCLDCYVEWSRIYDERIEPYLKRNPDKYFPLWNDFFNKFIKSNSNPSSRVGKI